MRGRIRLRLRARLIGALLIASAVTLIVASLAMLGPLAARLRNDEFDRLTAAAEATVPAVTRAARGLPAAGPELQAAAVRLGRRTRARVIVLDARGRVLAATDSEPSERLSGPRRTVAAGHGARHVVDTAEGREAEVVVPIRVRGRRLGVVLRTSLEDTDAAVRVIRRGLVTGGLIGLVVALAVGIALSSRLVRRITALRDAALRVARLGPASGDTPVEDRDEIGDLARAFTTMESRLEKQEAARRTFVATASHELRTPLTSLQLMLEVLADDLSRDPPALDDAERQAHRATRQTERLASLASELLDVSRIDADVPLRSEPVELGEVSRAVVAELSTGASPPPIELTAGEGCWGMGDPGAVARIVRILLDNALRFTPPGAPVRVAVAGEDGTGSIAVSDQGPGVPEAERELVFERFQRGSRAQEGEGFGLGLAIGRELATRMGGTLELADGARGARFVLVLPAAG